MSCKSGDGYLRDGEKVGKSVLVSIIVVMVRFSDFVVVFVVVVLYKLLNCVVNELKPSILFHGHGRQMIYHPPLLPSE